MPVGHEWRCNHCQSGERSGGQKRTKVSKNVGQNHTFAAFYCRHIEGDEAVEIKSRKIKK